MTQQPSRLARLVENIGFASLGLALAFVLFWTGVTNQGRDRGEAWALLTGLAFAGVSVLSLLIYRRLRR